MRLAVRCDASTHIGTGHLYRCLSLAESLTVLGAEVRFVLCRHAVAERIMATKPYAVCWLPLSRNTASSDAEAPAHAAWAEFTEDEDAARSINALREWNPKWVVVDHYAFGARWHLAVRDAISCSLFAIDDLGDRSLAADVLLDANVACDHVIKYAGRLIPGTRMLTGPRYALLSASYRSASLHTPDASVRTIGIFMGGTDQHNASGATLTILRREVGFAGPVEIVTTATAPHVIALARQCADDGAATLSLDLPDLSAFHARHDLQIGAGGTSSYERACIGTPTIAVVLAENQLAVVPVLDRMGIVRGATIPGIAATEILAGAEDLATVVSDLIARPAQRRAMSDRARALVDGRGAERVALSLLSETLTLRAASEEDAAMLHRWRDDPATRAVSTNGAAITYNDHVKWLASVIASPTRRLFVGMVGTLPVGSIRFDLNTYSAWEISLYVDPALHGLGLGSRLLAAGERAMLKECGGAATRTFHAKVEPGNLASLSMFEMAGYCADTDRLSKTMEAKL